MITEYIAAALDRAKYEIIEDEDPYYGEVLELEGVWATGKTLEECRHSLAEVIDGWLVVRLKKGMPAATWAVSWQSGGKRRGWGEGHKR